MMSGAGLHFLRFETVEGEIEVYEERFSMADYETGVRMVVSFSMERK